MSARRTICPAAPMPPVVTAAPQGVPFVARASSLGDWSTGPVETWVIGEGCTRVTFRKEHKQ